MDLGLGIERMDRGEGPREGDCEGEGGVDTSWIIEDPGEGPGLGGVLREPPNRNIGGGARFS